VTAPIEQYFLLMDPDWRPAADAEVPDVDAVVGLWPLGPEGGVGAFQSNPDYRPRNAGSAADPLDALFRMAGRGAGLADQIQLVLRDARFEVALNGDGRPLIVRSPDDVPCVVIATSAPQRERASAPQWRRIDLTELVSLLPDRVDVLFNPAGPMPFRLLGDFIRETLMMGDDEVAEAYEAVRAAMPAERQLEIVPWTVGAEPGRS
jgi:hypothetical protein